MAKKKLRTFDSIEQFVDFLSRGDEISFMHNKQIYWITKDQNGIWMVYKPYKDDSIAYMETIEEVLNYRITGIRIRDFITQVRIYHSNFYC